MDNQNSVPETPLSQIYTAPHLDNPPPPTPVKHFSVSKIILPALIFIVIILTISGIYLSQNYQPKPKPIVPKPTPTTAPSPTPTDETTNWKTYSQNVLRYYFKYPNNWRVYELKSYPYDGYPGIIDNNEIIVTTSDKFPRIQTDNSDQYIGFTISETGDVLERIKKVQIPDTAGNKSNVIEKNINGLKAYEETQSDGDKMIYFPYKDKTGGILVTILSPTVKSGNIEQVNQILSTFKFTDSSPTPTCVPRPACLDATPRCSIAETSDMCPKEVACTQDAKLCPDGSYVGRVAPNCEFATCP